MAVEYLAGRNGDLSRSLHQQEKAAIDVDLNVQQAALTQEQCILFRLPPEIRVLIWNYVLGGHMIHVFRLRIENTPLITPKCSLGPTTFNLSSGWPHKCCDSVPISYRRSQEEWEALYREESLSTGARLLPLVLTCRRIYSEGIEILYRDNVFDFKDMEELFCFSDAVLPKHFQRITSIKLGIKPGQRTNDRDLLSLQQSSWSWKTSSPSQKYLETWRILASLAFLRNLYVHMWMPCEEADLIHEPAQNVLTPCSWPRQTTKYELWLKCMFVTFPFPEWESKVWDVSGVPYKAHILYPVARHKYVYTGGQWVISSKK